MHRLTAGCVLAAAVLGTTTACVSSRDVAAESAPARVATPAPAAADVCPPIDSALLQRITGHSFQPEPVVVVDPDAADADCRWTATDGAAMVITRVHTKDPAAQFRLAVTSAAKNLGSTARIEVPGAQAAFATPNIGRFGLLEKDSYIEVNTIVPGAEAAQITKILTAVARG